MAVALDRSLPDSAQLPVELFALRAGQIVAAQTVIESGRLGTTLRPSQKAPTITISAAVVSVSPAFT